MRSTSINKAKRVLLINRDIPPKKSSIISVMESVAWVLCEHRYEVHFLGADPSIQGLVSEKIFLGKNKRYAVWVHRFGYDAKGGVLFRLLFKKSFLSKIKENFLWRNFALMRKARRYGLRLHRQYRFGHLYIHDARMVFGLLHTISKRPSAPAIVFCYHADVFAEFLFDLKAKLAFFRKKREAIPKQLPFLRDLLVQACKLPVYGIWLRITERSIIKKASRIHCASQYTRQIIENRYPKSADKIAVIPFALRKDYPDPPIVSPKRRASRSPFVFLTVRRLVWRMGLFALVDAFSYLVREDPGRYRLRIAGDGELYPLLARYIAVRGIPGIELLGYIPEDNLPQLYQDAHAFVLPTLDLEGFGLVILEASAHGLPVLATSAGAIPEVIQSFPSHRLIALPKNCLAPEEDWLRAFAVEMKRISIDIPKAEAIRNHLWKNWKWEGVLSLFR